VRDDGEVLDTRRPTQRPRQPRGPSGAGGRSSSSPRALRKVRLEVSSNWGAGELQLGQVALLIAGGRPEPEDAPGASGVDTEVAGTDGRARKTCCLRGAA